MYTNADQLTPGKKHELELMVNAEKPNLIAICEIKPKVGTRRQLHEYEFDDYKIANQTNADNNNGRGIVILSHTSIQHLVINVKSPTDFNEACIIEVRLSGSDLLVFACLYRSPTNNESSTENNENLNSLIKTISSTKKYSHRCFVGDFNFPTINWQNWTTSHMERSKEELFIDVLRDSFLHQHVNEPTRCRGTNDPSTIDLILTDEENQITNLQYLSPLGKSDHCTLSFNFKCYTDRKTTLKKYVFAAADFASMKNHLITTDWQSEFKNVATNKSVEELWQILKDAFTDLTKRFVPLKEVGNQYWKKKGKIPIPTEVQNMIKEKRRLHRKWLKSSPADRAHNRLNYITIRNRVNRMMTQARRAYEQNICDKSKFTNEPEGAIPDFQQRTVIPIDNMIITNAMVYNKLKDLDPNKSFGPDEIHPKMLIEIADYVAEPLAIIMNKTLENGTLPDDWKMAHVTPIYKNKGEQNLAINYRPVSLTSIVCKTMESLLREHIMAHLLNKELLSNKQYGFISKRSTVTQLLNYIDKCCESIANGKVVDSIYFDFAKAFDTVPHRRLQKKLESYGIRGPLLKWITSFLTDRKQLVKVNQARSTTNPVISGIPQGSVLGPLLFVIYINDLPENVVSSIFLFADDTKIFKEVNSINDSKIIQKDIDELEKWSNDWLLRFHPDKCHVLTIGKHSNIVHAHPYSLAGNQLEHTFIEKDLGVLIDSDLSFEEHISKQVNKANSMLGVIRRSFDYLSPKIFCTLYSTFVRPHLEYAQSVWSPKLRKRANLIERVQRRATRLVPMYRNLPYEERLRRLDLPSLEFRRHFGDMVQIYKHLHNYDQATIPKKIVRRTRPSRKHEFELLPNFANDGHRGPQSKSFYYRCITAWNNLPRDVVTAQTISSFKNRLNNAWKNHPLRYELRQS